MNDRVKKTMPHVRSGNALILVIGILVLLVLVATAFITRVQSGRVTTSAQRDAAEITDQARSVGRFVADEIATALFCKELTPAQPDGSANEPRRAPSPNALRYGSDNDVFGGGANPKPFNFAPYEVVPWTNPPDGLSNYPNGPANPFGGPSFGDSRWLRDTEPQRGDLFPVNGGDGLSETFTHWRHLSNLSRSGNAWRIAKDISDITDADGDGNGGLLTDLDVPVEQWPPWRPLRGVGLELGTQNYPALSNDISGQEHYSVIQQWFTPDGWHTAHEVGLERFLPQNFLDLSDLNGDGVHNDTGERAIDGFTQGTLRWNVERTMTDTDGDGFTDAFWHLSPHSLGSDTMQLVAVSVTDNSARGNLNVATRFQRSDSSSGFQDGEATKGHTPADLALVGSNSTTPSSWSVGFLDTPANSPANGSWVNYDGLSSTEVLWDTGQWSGSNASVLDELGIDGNPSLDDFSTSGNLSSTGNINSSYGRRWYWQLAGRDPFSATNGFRPYTAAGELELRIVEGNNYQFAGSRLERSLNSLNSTGKQFLRSNYNRHEATEMRDQLNNQQLVFDNRRKLTAFNGVRNDLLPPWLRWEERFWQRHDAAGTLPFGYDSFTLESYNNEFELWGSTFPSAVAIEALQAVASDGLEAALQVALNWREQSREKVDLREYYDPEPPGAAWAIWWESDSDGKLNLHQRAPLQIFLAMTDAQESGMNSHLDPSVLSLASHAPLGTYEVPDMDAEWFDNGPVNNYYQQARLMAAGLASNIVSYLDEDDRWRDHSPFAKHPSAGLTSFETPLSSAVPPPVLGNNGWEAGDPAYVDVPVRGPNDGDIMMLGLEAQPFILEAFIGHAHGAETEEYAPGACCLDGFCEVISEPTCIALNGVFEGSENCLLANCEYGACCLPDGGCIVMRQSNCNSVQGDYRGDNTLCELNKCLGKCCLYTGTCEELSLRSCAELGGGFSGYDTLCSGDCPALGACCLGSGSCLNVVSPNACSSLGGTYQGLQFCNTDPCLSPCCIDYTQCVNVTISTCSDLGGAYFGLDQACTELSCQPAGSCCAGSESCTAVASVTECTLIGGDFIAGVQCVEAPCNSSCCLGAGTCIEVSLGICVEIEGSYMQGLQCDLSPCRSACCFYTGGCEVMLQETCDLFGGVYKFGEYCVDSPCVPTGACCLPDDPGDPADGGCLDNLLETSCLALGGSYTNDGVSCGSVPCGEGAVRGACCLDTGNCQNVVSVDVCNTLGGEFQGALVSCVELPCSDTSACCVGNGSCLELEVDNCANVGGDFNPGLTCADSVCVGACCFPLGACLDNLAVDCLALGGTFISDRSCDTDPCEPTGACCISNQFCNIVTQDMCEISLGGAYEGANTTCGSDPCVLGVEGACCLEPVGCVMVIQAMCAEANGVWEGSGTCELNTCSIGSCCLNNGVTANCVNTANSSSCDILGGIYSAGELCDTDPCVGACCLWGGGCEEMSEESCDDLKDPDGNGEWGLSDAPGNFLGVGQNCGPITCTPAGSCCLLSDTCVDIANTRDFLDYCQLILGGTYRPGEFCADTDCGGACCLAFSPCSYVPEEQCIALGGTYAGDGVSCDGPDLVPDTGDEPCVFAGACCFGSGSCIDVAVEEHCDNLGGTYKDGEECVDSPCIQYFTVDAHVDDGDDGRNLWSDFQGTYAVVQLANPFDRLIDLNDYSIEFFGKEFKFDSVITPGVPDPSAMQLPPATPENPATVIVYAFPEDADMPDASIFADPLDPTPIIPDLNDDWKDFLDIEEVDHPQDDAGTVDDLNTIPIEGVEKTLFVKVPAGVWETTRPHYDGLDWDKEDTEYNSIALYKFDESQRVLIDRIDAPSSASQASFAGRVNDTLDTQWAKVGKTGYINTFIPFKPNTESILVHWDRVTRAWGMDVPEDLGWNNDSLDAYERNPRYIFSSNDFVRNGDDLDDPNNPDEPEFNGKRKITKNTYSGAQLMIEHTSEFHWTEFHDPDDFNGSGEMDDDVVLPGDDDELTDNPDPWFTVYLWHPSADDTNTHDGVVHGGFRHRKPTFFDMNKIENPPFPDKGWYGQREAATLTNAILPAYEDLDSSDGIDYSRNELNMDLTFPLQMLQKDDDFDQVGELLNVWLFGHMLEGEYYSPVDFDYNLELPESHLEDGQFNLGDRVNAGTITTFSEFMYPDWGAEDWWAPWVGVIDENDELVLDERVNRLRFIPKGTGGEDFQATPLMMDGRTEYLDGIQATTLNHPWPRQAIATRILDSFVCDGPGRVDLNNDGVGDDLSPVSSQDEWPSVHSFYNANGFSGKSTPGMININTAPVEVLRMLPHMYKVVHRTAAGNGNPRSVLPEAMVQWREGANGSWIPADATGISGGTDYSDRAFTLEMEFGAGPKQTRGFSSPAEIGLLRPVDSTESYNPDDIILEPWDSANHQAIRYADAWRIDFASLEPFEEFDALGEPLSIGTHISTDVNRKTYYSENSLSGDRVSRDAEEINMLQAGISNLISTNSDMFTVHMRIRTFKQNPITQVWDATNLEYIIDDSRYVMLVDRSNVNKPTDKPRIVYFEKLPN